MKEPLTPPPCAKEGYCIAAETSVRLIDRGLLPKRQITISEEHILDTLALNGKCIECHRRIGYHVRRGVIIKYQ